MHSVTEKSFVPLARSHWPGDDCNGIIMPCVREVRTHDVAVHHHRQEVVKALRVINDPPSNDCIKGNQRRTGA